MTLGLPNRVRSPSTYRFRTQTDPTSLGLPNRPAAYVELVLSDYFPALAPRMRSNGPDGRSAPWTHPDTY